MKLWSILYHQRTIICLDLTNVDILWKTMNRDFSGCANTWTKKCPALQQYPRRIVRFCKFHERRNVRTEICPDTGTLWNCLSNWCDYIISYTVQVHYIYRCWLYITPHMTCVIFIHIGWFVLLIVYVLWLYFILHFVNSLFNILFIWGNKVLNWIECA